MEADAGGAGRPEETVSGELGEAGLRARRQPGFKRGYADWQVIGLRVAAKIRRAPTNCHIMMDIDNNKEV